MIWNCDGEIKEIKFEYNEWMKGYYCCIESNFYVWEKGFWDAGPWEWYRQGYALTLAGWVS